MEVIIRADMDPSFLFEIKGPAQHAACIPNITREVKVKGNLAEDQLKTIEGLVEYSPVHGMVSHANNITAKASRG